MTLDRAVTGLLLAVLALLPPSAVDAREYVVQERDTLWSIAQRELGNGARWSELAERNNIADPAGLRSGAILYLPDDGDAPARQSDRSPEQQASVAPASADATPLSAGTPSAERDPPFVAPTLPSSPSSTLPTTTFSPDLSWSSSLLPQLAASRDASTPELTSPLTLDRVLALALTHSPAVMEARANLRSTAAAIDVERAAALPQLTASGEARRLETIRSTSGGVLLNENTYGGSVSLTQNLFSFGRISSALRAARAGEAAQVAALVEAEFEARHRAETAFLALLVASEKVGVAEQGVQAAQELARDARIREREGAGTRFDVMRAESELAAATARLSTSRSNLLKSRESLIVAMGLSAGTPLGELAPPPRPRTPIPADAAVRLAMTERPNLAVLAHELAASRHRVEGERAEGRPEAEAFATGSYTRHDVISRPSPFRDNDASSAVAGVRVSVPIFDGGRVRASVRQEEESVRASEAELRSERLEAEREVRAIYFDLSAAAEALASRRASVAASREALRMAEISFREGIVTALDVIQATLAFTVAREAELDAEFAYRVGLANLVRATGTPAVLQPESEARP